MWNRFLTENVAAEQVVILTALGCTKDPETLKVIGKKRKTNRYSLLIHILRTGLSSKHTYRCS